jgi:hypothetical protein
MSEEPAQEPFEHVEHAEHAAHIGTPFLLTVSVTIAILAVVAATVGSFESIETAAALREQNAANLLQNKTSDQWAFYQAKSIKKSFYQIAAQQGGARAAQLDDEAKRYDAEAREIDIKARELEHEVEARLHEAEDHEHRHHILTMAVTLLHAAIAITTIAIVTKGQSWPWLCGLALAATGVSMAGWAYM